jgi:ornithine cyclodeaminase
VALFEGETGQPVALIDGHPVTNWKTAADSALAQRHLAREGAKRLLVIGAGTLAPYLVKGHLAVRPSLTEVRVWNRSRGRAEAMVAELGEAGIQASIAGDLEAAVRAADVISTATLSEEALVKGAWLRPGQHLDLVGSFLPNMREADKAAVTAGRLFVDTRDGTVGRCGEIIDAGEPAIEGDLYDIAQGRKRRGPEEITVFKNAGGGHLDLMTAEFIAQKLGLMG